MANAADQRLTPVTDVAIDRFRNGGKRVKHHVCQNIRHFRAVDRALSNRSTVLAAAESFASRHPAVMARGRVSRQNPCMAHRLFPFRFRDPVTGKWVRARYKATRDEIAQRHAQWEIAGPAEVRDGGAAMFRPHYRILAHAEMLRLTEAPPVLHPQRATPPALDALEADLVRLFLRRYVTYCARQRRYAQMQGAAQLHAEVHRACGSAAWPNHG